MVDLKSQQALEAAFYYETASNRVLPCTLYKVVAKISMKFPELSRGQSSANIELSRIVFKQFVLFEQVISLNVF